MSKFWWAAGIAAVAVLAYQQKAHAGESFVDAKLLDSIMYVESRGNAHTENKRTGARGAYQFMPKTWDWLWRTIIIDPSKADFNNAFDLDISREAAQAYFRWIENYLKKKNLLTLDNLIASYNAGPGAVVKAKGVPNFKETQDYVKKVRDMMEKIK